MSEVKTPVMRSWEQPWDVEISKQKVELLSSDLANLGNYLQRFMSSDSNLTRDEYFKAANRWHTAKDFFKREISRCNGQLALIPNQDLAIYGISTNGNNTVELEKKADVSANQPLVLEVFQNPDSEIITIASNPKEPLSMPDAYVPTVAEAYISMNQLAIDLASGGRLTIMNGVSYE
ncbi:MAG: hypothetical protein WD432_02570 [Candidatus Saccharimonadales bacterium]